MKQLSSEDSLYYLLHDKKHVIQPGKRLPALDRKILTRASIPLYRGLSMHEHEILRTKTLNDTLQASTYWSTSESLAVANSWAKSYGTKRVVKFMNAKAFCLWRWGVKGLDALKASNYKDYLLQDGDYLKETYEEEAEWIMGFNMFKVSAIDSKGYPTILLDIT